MSAGSRIARPCLREASSQESLELRAPQLFRPVCALWPALVRVAPTRARLFPSLTSKGVSGQLRSLANARECGPDWRAFSPKRGGASDP